jgi:L-ascorbate metabolism protein UlaG (beta-lactamase superfamily)
MSTKITWHGHASFQIECNGISILIDPFFTGNPKAACRWEDVKHVDMVLLTHTHADHIGDTISLCKKHQAVLAAVVGAGEAMISKGLPPDLLLNGIGFNIGGSITHKGVTLTMTEATHTSEDGAPIGFIIQMSDGATVYHAGDTGVFGNMKTWGDLYDINIALLPTGGLFTMDKHQAAVAAKYLKADLIVPMHWGTFPSLAQNMDDFDAALKNCGASGKALSLKPGESYTCEFGN